jgi:hypothetical protein
VVAVVAAADKAELALEHSQRMVLLAPMATSKYSKNKQIVKIVGNHLARKKLSITIFIKVHRANLDELIFLL